MACFAWLAVPFGVRVRHPLPRYAMLLGLYTVLSVLWIVLVYTTIQKGPSPVVETSSGHSIATA